jgi:hypothetical protein
MSHLKTIYSDIVEMLEAECSTTFIASNIARDYDIPIRQAYDLVHEIHVAFEMDLTENEFEV